MTSRTIPKLDDTTFTRKEVQLAIQQQRSLANADLRGLDLSEMDFSGVNLENCKMAETNLSKSVFHGANLSGASLWKANLKRADFSNAILVDTDLERCILERTKFLGASIQRAILPLQIVTREEINDAVEHGTLLSGARSNR